MNQNFDELLKNASLKCEGKKVDHESLNNQFYQMYPFTTENIAGYIDYFNLNNRSLLTVGSSCDQIFSAIYRECSDITLLDVNPNAKYYFYLKKAAIIDLSLKEFLSFFRFRDYPSRFESNSNVFDYKLFSKLSYTLRSLDEEAFVFWSTLFNNYNPIKVRRGLFTADEDDNYTIKCCNNYLYNKNNYEKLKSLIDEANIDFINGNILSKEIDKDYDNIWLSNVAMYLDEETFKYMSDKMIKHLNPNGMILLAYLYDTTLHSDFQKDFYFIYDLDKTFELLSEYKPDFITFQGVCGIKYASEMKDSIILYRKLKH